MALAHPLASHGFTRTASSMLPVTPVNSDKIRGFLASFWHRTYSMLVVFMPSRMEVIRARSATDKRAKYSSRSMIWW